MTALAYDMTSRCTYMSCCDTDLTLYKSLQYHLLANKARGLGGKEEVCGRNA